MFGCNEFVFMCERACTVEIISVDFSVNVEGRMCMFKCYYYYYLLLVFGSLEQNPYSYDRCN